MEDFLTETCSTKEDTRMKVLAKEPLTTTVLKQIERILHESKCPHESLRETFPRYIGMNGIAIHFDSYDGWSYSYDIKVPEENG